MILKVSPTSLTQLILKVQRGIVLSSRKPSNQSDIVPWCAMWAYGSVGTDIPLSVDRLLVLKYDGLVYTTNPIYINNKIIFYILQESCGIIIYSDRAKGLYFAACMNLVFKVNALSSLPPYTQMQSAGISIRISIRMYTYMCFVTVQ